MAGEIQSFKLQDIDRFVAFVNPASSNGEQIYEQMDAIQAVTGLQPERLFSLADPERTDELLVKTVLPKLDKGTLLAVFGGDGLANLAVNTLAGDNSTYDSREATVLFTANGNANDTARGLLSATLLKRPGELLARDDLVTAEAHPLLAEFETPGGREARIALSYVGVGADAAGALALNQAKPQMSMWRKRYGAPGRLWQKAREPDIVARAASAAPRFDVTEKNPPDHHLTYERAIELLVANGSRMAKYGRWPLTSLLEQNVEIALRTSRFDGPLRIPTVVANGIRMAAGRLGTEYDGGFEKHGYSRTWDITNIQRTKKNRPLLVQYDGETTEIEEGELTISQTPPLRVLTREVIAQNLIS